MQWIIDNWSSISLVLAILFPFVAKVPFVEHSVIAEILIKAIIAILPKNPASQNVQDSAKVQETELNPKK